jgi:ZIP family zinc transporter
MCVRVRVRAQPEGFAVAFSAFTPVGPIMCGAIAAHNIPEGLVIAAPIYAATGSKSRAVLAATLSGLSEPLGALVALGVARPFVTSAQRLDFVLAFVGGIMIAVCVLELWPEGRRCRQDTRLAQGILAGAAAMGCTLAAGV